jgi:hypothetical protein
MRIGLSSPSIMPSLGFSRTNTKDYPVPQNITTNTARCKDDGVAVSASLSTEGDFLDIHLEEVDEEHGAAQRLAAADDELCDLATGFSPFFTGAPTLFR